MFQPVKSTIVTILLILSGMAFAQGFNLKIYVDRSGNPDPGGKPFEQYFNCYPMSDSVVISICGGKYIFNYLLTPDNIRKNRLDVINWEIEKTMRREIFKLSQIKPSTTPNGMGPSGIIAFLHFFPDGSECIAPVFYLWQQTAGSNHASGIYNFCTILSKLGNSGKTYAKIIEENNSRSHSTTNTTGNELFNHYANPSFENLAKAFSHDYSDSPEIRRYESVVLQMLEHKSPQEIVKYLLANNVITQKNFTWLTLFLKMCPEWPPEAIEFLKKEYIAQGMKKDMSFRDKIVAVSVRNAEMKRWLKPYMAKFVTDKEMRVNVAVAYMLIIGESDPAEIARDHLFREDDVIYEYAYATGKYNNACKLIEKLKPRYPGSIRKMLYDKSDLSTEYRIMIFKLFLNLTDFDPITKNFWEEGRLLHPDNLPALLTLTKDVKYASNAWLSIRAFPVSEMPPDVAAQYFAHCEQELKSPDVKVRNEAIRSLRFFIVDAQRPEAVKLLFNQLLSSDPAAVAAASDSLTAMGPACIPELLEAVGGSELYFALRACELIGGMGLYGQKAAPGLLKQLQSNPDWMIKTMIIKALALSKGTEAIPEIEKYVSAREPILASTAAQALVLLKPIPKEILNDPSDFVRNYNKPVAR